MVKADDSPSGPGPGFDSRLSILNGCHEIAPNVAYPTLSKLQRLMVGRLKNILFYYHLGAATSWE